MSNGKKVVDLIFSPVLSDICYFCSTGKVDKRDQTAASIGLYGNTRRVCKDCHTAFKQGVTKVASEAYQKGNYKEFQVDFWNSEIAACRNRAEFFRVIGDDAMCQFQNYMANNLQKALESRCWEGSSDEEDVIDDDEGVDDEFIKEEVLSQEY